MSLLLVLGVSLALPGAAPPPPALRVAVVGAGPAGLTLAHALLTLPGPQPIQVPCMQHCP